MLCGTDIEYSINILIFNKNGGNTTGIIYEILSIPQNVDMDLNNLKIYWAQLVKTQVLIA